MHRRVDGVIDVQDGAEDLRDHLAQIGVREIERDVAAPGVLRAAADGDHRRGSVGDLRWQRGVGRS
jgi:hypothetical protein